MKTTTLMSLIALAAMTAARGESSDSAPAAPAKVAERIAIASAATAGGSGSSSSSSTATTMKDAVISITGAADGDGEVQFHIVGPDGKETTEVAGGFTDVALPMRWAFSSGNGEDTFISRKPSGPVTYLGLSTAPVTEDLAPHLPVPPDTGLVVEVVAADSPAEKAGLLRNDILARLDDQILIQPRQLSVLVANHKEGDKVKLVLIRQGKEAEVIATLGKKENTVSTTGWKGVGGGFGTSGAAVPLRTFTRRLEVHPPGPDGAPEIKELPDATAQQYKLAMEALQGAVGKKDKTAATASDANAAVEKQLAELRAQLEELSRTIKQTGEKK
ncbi:PDZ domain-containing protein [Luteolibacter ambystomatis]|uniref:PDZ domain-containing protein n=1 Tax=Luteolibacter ambystomatis TaxID=2824561 RepID=A0A975G5K0_9BACT|nr:PDZ domain-containing protein [Luteolibacter ambystomatis]QUE49368.1 PDZ domain-containing protein [Luteolibacter ambystomatis]